MSKDSTYVQGLLSRQTDFKKEREELMQSLKDGQDRLQTLNGAIAGIDQLLILEGVTPVIATSTASTVVSEDQSLAEVLKMILSDRKPRTVEELAELLKETGFDFENKNPLRAVGFTLMGMGRGEKYTKFSDGRWKFIG
ncbi:MAG: hypothetical protein EPO19_05735 [Betaproteobacteria bacterium]|nr:MAG: hypothetical protein EPO19_05735 [Betaproteobacteria bacterium]